MKTKLHETPATAPAADTFPALFKTDEGTIILRTAKDRAFTLVKGVRHNSSSVGSEWTCIADDLCTRITSPTTITFNAE